MMTSWRGEEFMDGISAVMDERLGLACEALATYQRQLVSTDAPPVSSPGNPPHRETGNLQARIEVRNPFNWRNHYLSRQVGSSAPYTIYLEFGTEKMEARPFLMKSLIEMAPTLYRIIVGDLWSGPVGAQVPYTDPRRLIQPFAASFSESYRPAYQSSAQGSFSEQN